MKSLVALAALCAAVTAHAAALVCGGVGADERSATAVVAATSSRPAHLALGFPQSAADGDLDLKPSVEEKMQAKQP